MGQSIVEELQPLFDPRSVAVFLAALAEQWVADHNKPVITTTFAEGQPILRGSHYAYPSGGQAARVLVKLVEYKEYLEKVGVHDS